MTNIEYISVPLEIKSLQSGEFEGYGSTFGNIDLGGDVVMPGAFKKSIEHHRKNDSWPQMFWMHDPKQIPGMWTDMSEDDVGLRVRGKSLPTTVGRDVEVLMKAKAVKTLSIGFSLDHRDAYEYKDDVRLLHEINLWEVSPVSLAMNPKAKINAVKARLHKSGICLTDLMRELEAWFKSQGLSKSQAITLAGRALAPDDQSGEGFGAMPLLDANGDDSGAIPEESRRDAGKANSEPRPSDEPQLSYEEIKLIQAFDRLSRCIAD